MREMREDVSQKGTGSLVTDALSQLSRLVRGEVALARAEIEQSIRKAGMGVLRIAAGGVLAIVALNVLAAALVAAVVTAGVTAGWAALIVGAALILLALILILTGLNALKATNFAPTQTIENVSRDAATLSEALTDDKSR